VSILSFQIFLEWSNVILKSETGQVYEYPGKFTRYMQDQYCRPAVYKWSVHPVEFGKPQPVYIGEANNLLLRIQRVLTPARAAKRGDTNARLKKVFDEHISSGRHVSLAVLNVQSFEIDGALFSADRLGHQYVRRALENICLCVAEAGGQDLLNRKIEPVDRVIKEIQKLTPKQRTEILRVAKEMQGSKGYQ